MSDNKRYCMGCMKLIEADAPVCPHCGYASDIPQQSPYLSQGQVIAQRYLVGKVLSMANDSITYIGLDKITNEPVTLCEYYPNKIAHRANGSNFVSPLVGYSVLYESCLKSFLSLWRGIRMFDDIRCLPHVLDIVTENDTAYSVSAHKDCMTLKDYFEKTRKPLTYSKAVAAFAPLLKALNSLHNAGIVHGSITPSTIQVGPDGRLNLTGFSIPQCHSEIRELCTKPVSGFSPLELYETYSAKPESDIYSVMAVMYYSITGSVLPKATDRVHNENLSLPSSIASTIPKNILDALVQSLAVYPYKRISSVDKLLELLKSAPSQPVNKQTNSQTNNQINNQTNKNPKPVNNKMATEKKPTQKQTQTRTSAPKPRPKQTREDDAEEANKADSNLLVLGVATFVAATVVISILFCVLYSTVLYKSVDIPILNKAFSSMAFLPMNKEDEEETEVIATTDTEPSLTGTSYATVADFTKLTYDYIISNDSFQRNFVLKFKEEPSDKIKKGGIISQSAVAGESVPVGTVIVLTVSSGIEQIVVPDVKGKSFEDAKEILEDAHFVVSKELLDNTENKTPGEVYRMSEDAGMSVDKGTVIVLSVWDEIPETTTQATTKESTTSSTTPDSSAATSTTKPTTTKPTTTKPTTTKAETTKEASAQ